MGVSTAKVDEKRVAAAIKGAIVADAASMGTHYMDAEESEAAVPSPDAPEFKAVSYTHLTLPTTPYV